MNAPDVVEEILAHHGVKGMQWGVRRARSRSSDVSVVDKKKKLKTYGGKGRPAHSDAVSARTSGQIARKSGIKALSNAELRAFNERLNLEQNAKRLSFQDQSKSKKFVLTLIGKKAPGAIETGGKAALNSSFARKRMAKGAAALAIAIP